MQNNNNTDNNNYKTKIKKKKDLVAPQLATVDVTLNAFYGIPMLSPTTRSLQNLKLRL